MPSKDKLREVVLLSVQEQLLLEETSHNTGISKSSLLRRAFLYVLRTEQLIEMMNQ